MNRVVGDSHLDFTPRQGQYLAFIHAYTLVNGRPPAQADIQRFSRLTPPSVYQMLLTLEREGLTSRHPGVPRSITVLVDRAFFSPRWNQRGFNRSKPLCRGTGTVPCQAARTSRLMTKQGGDVVYREMHYRRTPRKHRREGNKNGEQTIRDRALPVRCRQLHAPR
jgi:hypothetical protein